MAGEDHGSEAVVAPRFGTFQGVFRPTLLSILGGQLFLREGWLVGNAGLVGALAIIGAAYLITGATALSLSSIATNTRLRAGGPFAIIAQALGLEAGGAIGIPLFLAQALASAMYLYAFTEGWGYLFPSHDPKVVVTIAFVAVSALSFRSSDLALRTQGVLLIAVVLALVSVLLGALTHEAVSPTLFSDFPDASFSRTFAIFFPAATGVTVGAAMSGQLEDPRVSIPKGTMWAWGITLATYLTFAVWCAFIADRATLLSDNLVMVERALFGPAVLAGIACLNLMAALSCMLTASRLLQAMAEQGVIPMGRALAYQDARGEPVGAALLTIGVGALALTSGSLNAIAPLITSLFIVTYFAINGVVWLEYSLGMISFRPTFDVGERVPLIGMIVSLFALVGTSAGGGVLELLLVVGVYVWLANRKLRTPWETVHSGIDVSIAAWAARRAVGVERSERAWKPDVLALVDDPSELSAMRPLLEGLSHAHGSIKLVGMGEHPAIEEAIHRTAQTLQAQGVHTSWSRLHTSTEFRSGATLALEALQGSFFPPNLVLVDGARRSQADLQALVDRSVQLELGTLVSLGMTGPLPDRPTVAVWLSDRSPDWNLRLHNANLNLPVLLAYLVSRPLGAMRLVTVVQEAGHQMAALGFLERLCAMGRLPRDTAREVVHAPFMQAVEAMKGVDLHLFGLARHVELERLIAIQRSAGGPCLFTLDSGRESVVA